MIFYMNLTAVFHSSTYQWAWGDERNTLESISSPSIEIYLNLVTYVFVVIVVLFCIWYREVNIGS